jgi:hypothetical protein
MELLPQGINIDFVGKRRLFLAVSSVVNILAVVLIVAV